MTLGIPADIRGVADVTPLMLAVFYTNTNRMALLIKHGANIKAVNAAGWNTVYFAAFSKAGLALKEHYGATLKTVAASVL